MDSAEAYANQVDKVVAQRTRLHGGEIQDDSWGGTTARRFRFDPLRQLGANIEAIASYVQPEDTVVDVGGGAGRVSLPLALRCQEVTTVTCTDQNILGQPDFFPRYRDRRTTPS